MAGFWRQRSKQAPDIAQIRALVIADTYPDFGSDIPQYVKTHAVDVVITAGDLGRADLVGIDRLDVPVMGVYGNHCRRGYFDELGITNLHLAQRVINGVSFTGLEGCVRYKDSRADVLYSQSEYREMVAQLPVADIIVTHCPPRGINDHPSDPAHVGINALLPWIEQATPRVLIHGHTYPKRPITVHGPTQIEYVHGGRIIEI